MQRWKSSDGTIERKHPEEGKCLHDKIAAQESENALARQLYYWHHNKSSSEKGRKFWRIVFASTIAEVTRGGGERRSEFSNGRWSVYGRAQGERNITCVGHTLSDSAQDIGFNTVQRTGRDRKRHCKEGRRKVRTHREEITVTSPEWIEGEIIMVMLSTYCR